MHDVEKDTSQHLEFSQKEDEAVQVDYSGAHAKIDPVEIKLVKKLDLFIMPTLWIMYAFNYLDRNAIALARLDNLQDDLGLNSTQYQTSVMILFVGYLAGQVPSNMLLTRIRPSYYMAACMALWAVVSALTAVCTNYTGLVLCRFFLGVTEAPFYPGALYILSTFYTRKEIALRISILYSAALTATAVAGLIAIGIFELSGRYGIAGWQWLFIIQGGITFVIAVISAFILPDEPLTTKWLSEEQRQLAHSRMSNDTVESRTSTTTWTGLLECSKDVRLWVFVLMQHMHIAAGAYKNFFPTVIETLGFGRKTTLGLTCPPYFLAAVASLLWAGNSGRMNERTWHITIAKLVAMTGFILGCATLNIGASIILGWVSSTCGQTKEKKAVSLAMVNTFASISQIWTAYLWPEGDEPRYTMAMTTSAAVSFAALVLAWVMRFMLRRANAKLSRTDNSERLRYAY
ncbi:MFS general substrate transporter [Cadophora sp. DSE1049]|nr:MFS general substrate transporter [Cadophora sp. DSE1049]